MYEIPAPPHVTKIKARQRFMAIVSYGTATTWWWQSSVCLNLCASDCSCLLCGHVGCARQQAMNNVFSPSGRLFSNNAWNSFVTIRQHDWSDSTSIYFNDINLTYIFLMFYYSSRSRPVWWCFDAASTWRCVMRNDHSQK